jgi:hypothetical protein
MSATAIKGLMAIIEARFTAVLAKQDDTVRVLEEGHAAEIRTLNGKIQTLTDELSEVKIMQTRMAASVAHQHQQPQQRQQPWHSSSSNRSNISNRSNNSDSSKDPRTLTHRSVPRGPPRSSMRRNSQASRRLNGRFEKVGIPRRRESAGTVNRR